MGIGFCGLLFFIAFILIETADAQKGKTLFGDNRKETYRAMKAVANSLNVKCTFCHLKSGGKYDYTSPTPHKNVGRQMKISFVDSLTIKGSAKVLIPVDYGNLVVTAQYVPEDNHNVILLKSVDPTAGKEAVRHVRLPPDGEDLHCMTCHQGKLHFMYQSDSQDNAVLHELHAITNSVGDPVIRFTFDWGSSDQEQRGIFTEKIIVGLHKKAVENPKKTRVVCEAEMKYKNRYGEPQTGIVSYTQTDLSDIRRYSNALFLETAGEPHIRTFLEFLSNQGYICNSEECRGPNW